MSQTSDPFDPYFEWLDIAPQDQPLTFYRLLGVQDFEPDLAVIEQAAKKRTAHLHPMASGPKRDSVQMLLREIAKARRTLLSEESKLSYDAALRTRSVEQRQGRTPHRDELPASTPSSSGEPNSVRELGTAVGSINIATDAQRSHRTEIPPGSSPIPRRPKRFGLRVALTLIICLGGAIAFVLYKQGRPEASVVADSENTKPTAFDRIVQQSKSRSPARPNRQNANRSKKPSAPDTATTTGGQKPVAANSRPKRPSDTKSASGEKFGKPARTPKFASPDFSDDWLEPLPPLDINQLEVRNGTDLVAIESDRIRLLPGGKQPLAGDLVAKGVTLDTAHTVAVRTNFRSGLPDAMRLGLRVGPIRLILESKRNQIQIKMLQQKLTTWKPKKGAPLTIAISRDPVNFSACQWLVTDGTKSIAGRARINADAGLSLPTGVFYSTSKKKLDEPVWIDQFRFGKLLQPLVQEDTQLITVKVRDK